MKNNSATVYIIQSVILHLLSAGQYVHLPCRRAHICDSLSDVRQAKLVQASWAIQPGRSLTPAFAGARPAPAEAGRSNELCGAIRARPSALLVGWRGRS